MAKKVVIFHPYVNLYMRLLVDKVLRSRFIGQGPMVDKFEEKFKETFDVKYPVMVNSGTSALTLAYYLAGIKKGDEVITPVLTCTATNLPLLHLGAKIVFADINKDTLNVSFDDIKRKITKKTKAIVNVHLNGNFNPIKFITNIPIIGDYSQCHITPFGENYACYSLQAIKHITTGDGGVIVLNNVKEYKRAKKLRWFGIDRETKLRANWQPYIRRKMTMDIKEPGWKIQPTDINAALGLGSLQEYKKIISYHQELSCLYSYLLTDIPDLQIIGGTWSFPILVERRDDFCKMLMSNGIETNLVQLRNDIFTCFGGKRQKLPNMNWVESRYVSLPLHMLVTEEDVIRICNLIKKGW